MILNTDSILNQFGGYKPNDLNEKLSLYDEETNEIPTISLSPYLTNAMIPNYLKDYGHSFTVMSLNCQSINAKCGLLEAMLYELQQSDFAYSAICIQESWLSGNPPDMAAFEIPGYHTIARNSTVGRNGGLIIYLKDDYSYKIMNAHAPSNMWECMFLEISGGSLPQPILLGNVYRPPRNNNDNDSIRRFNTELSSVINILTKSNLNIIISGEFNINLLEINERECYGEFLDLMITNELFQKISLLTRRCKTKVSLIDQMFCRFKSFNKRIKSGIIYGATSDHYAYFTCIDMNTIANAVPKYVRINVSSEAAIDLFVADVNDANIYGLLDNNLIADPNENYNIIENIIIDSKNKHIPSKLVRFNKYKHKLSPWITNGILTSISFREKLYHKLGKTQKDSATYDILNNNLRNYKNILNKAIRIAKREYYHGLLIKYKHDLKKTWTTINTLLCRNKKTKSLSNAVKTDHGKITDKKEIANYFNNYFDSVGQKLANSINHTNEHDYKRYLSKILNCSFSFKQINPADISKIIHNFLPKTSCGHDGLSMKLIKRLKDIISRPLSLIINQSFCTGIFPEKNENSENKTSFQEGGSRYCG